MLTTTIFTERVPEKGVTDGHVHFSLSSSDPEDLATVGVCANVVSSILFEKLGAQGTNMIISLTDEGGTLDVVARSENDGLGLEWAPKQLSGEQLDAVAQQLRDKTFILEQGDEPVPEEESYSEDDDEADDVMVKQLLRIP